MNILLVDDEPLELEQLEYLIKLQFPQYKILKALDASEALRIAEKEHIFLAFLDIQLPGKNGLDLGMELKKKYDMDLIIVTAFQTFEYAHTSIRLGVTDYITKPIIEEELVRVLKKYKHIDVYSDFIQKTIEIIKEEYKERLNLTYIASKIHMNPAYLSRKFHEEVGLGFSEYLNQYRIEAAKQLLKDNMDRNIYTIAEECGFNSQHYFSHLFRKITGLSPRDYRLKELKR
ncbi:response regulator transcription factor [Ectobacillus panaciterrae]|uniref:response regulator transcription factor n=1 Tax=Ectobacillus panaciterrae TaxID=363872 RepID=UPI00049030C4|nr:helix-turn-helix domain-containing protein [Ectobacillus panaciterrae]